VLRVSAGAGPLASAPLCSWVPERLGVSARGVRGARCCVAGVMRAAFRRAGDEGRALVAVRDFSKDIGVTNQADRRSILG